MDTQQIDEKAIFNAARRIVDGAARDDYLTQACGDDHSAIQRIRELLRIHEHERSFLEFPPAEFAATAANSVVTESAGTVIGPYKLLQQIGEGGMGVVFLAEQERPVQRTVALKIIKPGMDTRQVIARFEAERQALAVMDHPNIAKVLDAGATDTGRPYFVMDLVKGIPITDYCDQQHLSIRQRLDLFAPVCQAVQHAHQKGIIHRDLKPTNVLVAEYDNHPVPKVIDFGVAKATAQKHTERTMFTEFGQVIGTFEYMSPEQAKLNRLDIDIRTDIYSLGVLLYELITGETPFDRKRLHSAAFDEVLRIIREEEPPKPSTKLSTSDTLPSIAAQRHTEPAKLSKQITGELDWIVMKCLEKDRGRRYESANGLASDIERHLRDEPVQAGPPSAAYRFRKFAKRNRVALTSAVLIALSILVALGGIASGIGWAVRDRAAREELLAQERIAREARVTGQIDSILDDVARLEQQEKWSEALASALRAESVLAAGEAPPDVQNRVRQAVADLELVQRLNWIRAESGTIWAEERELLEESRLADQQYAATFREAGIDLDVLTGREAIDRIVARPAILAGILPALDDWAVVRTKVQNEAAARRLIEALQGADPDPWRRKARDALVRKDRRALRRLAESEDLDQLPAATLYFLYTALRAQDIWPLQMEVLERAQRIYPHDYWTNHRLGVHHIWRREPHRVAEGIGYMRAALAVRPQGPDAAHAYLNLGNGYAFLQQYDQAIACNRKAIELLPNYGAAYSNLGVVLAKKGEYEEAIAALEEAIRVGKDLFPAAKAETYSQLAMSLSHRAEAQPKDVERAVKLAEDAVSLTRSRSANVAWTALGAARYRQGKWQEARMALERSLELRPNAAPGDQLWNEAVDGFLLALSCWQLEEKQQARQWNDRAVQWMAEHPTDDAQLRRIRAEAEELLKFDNPTKQD